MHDPASELPRTPLLGTSGMALLEPAALHVRPETFARFEKYSRVALNVVAHRGANLFQKRTFLILGQPPKLAAVV